MRAGLLRRLARRAGIRLFRLFVRRIDPAASPSAGIRFMEEAELRGRCADPALDLQPDKVLAAFARGDLCAGAFDGERLAGYCWFAFAPVPLLDGVWVDFPAATAWPYKSLVLPAYRGKGIAPALYRHADRACLERRRATSLICVESHNRPSIAAALRAGYGAAGHSGYRLAGASLQSWHSRAAREQAPKFFLP